MLFAITSAGHLQVVLTSGELTERKAALPTDVWFVAGCASKVLWSSVSTCRINRTFAPCGHHGQANRGIDLEELDGVTYVGLIHFTGRPYNLLVYPILWHSETVHACVGPSYTNFKLIMTFLLALNFLWGPSLMHSALWESAL